MIITKKSNSAYRTKILAGGENIITFFTPTYNRAQFLGRVYECLKNQTTSNFVWIVVNDGSSDNTDIIIENYINQNRIPLLYISKTNGGKHSAFKIALAECRTEFFQCMDDDDIYSNESVATFLSIWNSIKNDNNRKIAAIRTLSRKPDGRIVTSKQIFGDVDKYIDSSTLDMNYIHKVKQENWTCYKTSALKSIDLFPESYWLSEKHNFFSEAIWQGRFARKYICRYYNVVLREYRDDAEFSIIRAKKNQQHYTDMFINTKMILDEQYDYISRSLTHLITNIAMVQILRAFLKISFKDLILNTSSKKLKVWYYLTFPMSFFSKPILAYRTR